MKSVAYIYPSIILGFSCIVLPSLVSAQGEVGADQLPIADIIVEMPQSSPADGESSVVPQQQPPLAVPEIDNEQAPDFGMEPLGGSSYESITCTGFAELSSEQRMEYIVLLETAKNEQFCSLTAGFSCGDHQDSLQDFGVLKPAATAGFCRFVPMGTL